MRQNLAYFGSRISENMAETPEGFLVCRSVPIARTGAQTYLPEEIGLPGGAPVSVFRTEREVFSPAALASFEGKPVTLGHPPEDVSPRNAASYARGHVQNVRRGTGPDACYILADLFLTDPALIDRVRGGLREVSCGYRCVYAGGPRGVEQRAIRGNHVAVVEAGRAGSRVAIRDGQTVPDERRLPMKLRKPRHICDGEPDAFETICQLLQRIALLLESLTAAPLDDPGAALAQPGNPGAQLLCEASDEPQPDCAEAVRAAISAVKPLIAALPEPQRTEAADRAARAIRRARGTSDSSPSAYAALAARSPVPVPDDGDLGRRIMEARNPHYRKG